MGTGDGVEMGAAGRLYVAWLAEDVREGHAAARAPRHLTLVPPFHAPERTALAAIEEAVAGRRPFRIRAERAERLGGRRDIPVVVVGPPARLRALHDALMGALAARGAGPAGALHTGDAFLPHITLRGAGGPDVPVGRRMTVDHVALLRTGGGGTTVVARRRLGAMEVTRENAWAMLTRYTQSEALRRHALAVEAAVRSYARRAGEDEEYWGAAALLHDFDYEMHPTLDRHPKDGAPILREEGWPEDIVETVLSHAEHMGLPRDTALKRTLFACDELSGFVHACGLVRPTGLEGLTPKSVRKKLKQSSFAAGVDRDEVAQGAELLGIPLDEHIANVVAALQPIAAELGLPAGGGSG